jgi:cobalt/nickel transport system ATP-binding protein
MPLPQQTKPASKQIARSDALCLFLLETPRQERHNPTMSAAPIIELKRVSFRYPGGPPVLCELDFRLNRSERVGIMAPNGSGKTTLFHLIMGLVKPFSGSIEIFGREVREEKDFAEVRRRIGLLFQDPDDQLFSPTVLEDVAFGPLNLGKSRDEAVAAARRTLAFLGLEGFEERVTFKLSGGEKRLVSLAAVLAMEPEALLLDEPVNGLDTRTRARLMQVLLELKQPYVLISHEPDFLAAVTTTAYTMDKGRVVADPAIHPHEHVHAHPLGTCPHEHYPLK